MKSHDTESLHSTALFGAEQRLTTELTNSSRFVAGKPNFDNVYSELSSLRSTDNKLFRSNSDKQFENDLGDINKYLESKHLPPLDIDSKELAPKLEEDLKEATKTKNFSNVYGRLEALKQADEAKYGKELGDLLYNQQVHNINRYLHQHGFPDLTLTDDGESVIQGHGRHQKAISNSRQEARQQRRAASHAPYQGSSPEAQGRQASAGRASSAMGDYVGNHGSDRSGSMVGLSGGEKATSNQIMNKLVNEYGLSPAGAAGVVGNMTQENGLKTEANSGGIGLCQWIGSRAREERQFAAQMGESPTSLNAQVAFMMHELKRDYPQLLDTLKTTNDPQTAALDFSKIFERPGNPQNGNRMSYALDAHRTFNSTPAAGASQGS